MGELERELWELLDKKAININKVEAFGVLKRNKKIWRKFEKFSPYTQKNIFDKVYRAWRDDLIQNYDFSGFEGSERGRKTKKTEEEKTQTIKNNVAKTDYKFISVEHKDSCTFSMVTVECPRGHIWRVQYARFRSRKFNCPKCNYENERKGGRKTSDSTLRAEMLKEGYTFIQQYKKGNFILVEVECPKGHNHHYHLANWRKGQRCPKCLGGKK